MNVKFFCSRWGSEGADWKDFLIKAKKNGYDGIEFGILQNFSRSALDDIWGLAAECEMLLIPQHYDTISADYSKHYDTYAAWLEKVKPYKALKINSQTGRDFFSFEQNYSLIELAERFAQETGTPVYHEIHRSKFSFAAHITHKYLNEIASLRLTLDASHWICVAESFLEDQPDSVNLAIERTEHIHARIGYTEGPQVPDPRSSEWADALQTHLGWWDRVASRKMKENKLLTITPEFGPFPYMVSSPFTQKPIANQWDVNLYMMELLKERYGKYTV
jgi:sugar phosphate isomerase/epimerase